MARSTYDNLQQATDMRRMWVYALGILVAPLLTMGFLSADLHRSNLEEIQLVESQRTQIELAELMAGLVSELQRERGRSTAYLASSGQQYEPEMQSQRETTDSVLEQTRKDLNAIDQGKLSKGFGASPPAAESLEHALADARDLLGALPEIRERVDDLSITAPDQQARYTEIIRSLMGVANMSAGFGLTDTGQRLSEMADILQDAIEYAARERAAGTLGFSTGRFDTETTFQMIEFNSAQQVLFGQFRRVAPPSYSRELDTIVSSAASTQLNRLRSRALSNSAGNFALLSDWFTTTTSMIDGYKALATKLRLDQYLLLMERQELLLRDYHRALAAVILSMVMSLTIALWLSHHYMRPFRLFASSLGQFRDSKEPTKVIGHS